MSYSDVGYTIWFVATTMFVIVILVVGMIMASGTKIRHRSPRIGHRHPQ